MAKPLRKTPTLTGEQADTFVEGMLSTEKRRRFNKSEQILWNLIN